MIYKNTTNNLPVNLIIDIGSKNLKFFVYQVKEEKVKVEYYYQVEHGINFSFLKGFDSKKLLNLIVEVLEVFVQKFSFELRQMHVSLADELVIVKRNKTSFSLASEPKLIDLGEIKNLIHKSQWKIINSTKSHFLEENPDSQIKLLTSYINSIKVDDQYTLNPVGVMAENIQFDYISAFVNPQIYDLFLEVFNSLDISLSSVLINTFAYTNLKDNNQLLFLDLGAKVTNLCLIKDNKFEYIKTLDFGVDIISNQISESLKLPLDQTENLLIDYCRNNFEKIDFYTFRKAVMKGARQLVSKLNLNNLEYSEIKLFGGGSHIPEFSEVLIEKDSNLKISQLSFQDFSLENPDYNFPDLSALNCLNLAFFVSDKSNSPSLNQVLSQVIKLMQI
ncbi:hypothetical protein CL656_03870 [bacterium]|nr:hypothetical protein [bacterium]|tara:strand:- start:4530 stop:5699 length:1170 start_codon:yes stop_codon:yes gene_type:complete